MITTAVKIMGARMPDKANSFSFLGGDEAPGNSIVKVSLLDKPSLNGKNKEGA